MGGSLKWGTGGARDGDSVENRLTSGRFTGQQLNLFSMGVCGYMDKGEARIHMEYIDNGK